MDITSEESTESRPAYLHAALSGGIGGVTGDMLMHSLDTVKTRQQGDPTTPRKYTSLRPTYQLILSQEGLRRGLYGGVTPAFLGSFGGTFLFFGSYEWSKRWLLDAGVTPTASFFVAGLVADLVASPLYVPSEVLKTRLQLQGRYRNPYFTSGYNYRGFVHALRTIARTEGVSALFYGYRATLYRDLPFSALQFAFYEKEREAAKWWAGTGGLVGKERNNIGLPLEILVGASAGGMAGILTCPLDVVKTRIQTQVNKTSSSPSSCTTTPRPSTTSSTTTRAQKQTRNISTGAPSAPLRPTATPSTRLDTSSVLTGLRMIYRTEGLAGWFRGVGPRAVWTSVQSGVMLVLYQVLLGKFEEYPLVRD